MRKIDPLSLEPGDRIMCLHMAQETSVPIGTEGTVTKVQKDPTSIDDAYRVSVQWDNGGNLSLLSDVDTWKKLKKEDGDQLKENQREKFFEQHEDVFEFFDRRFFNNFLLKMRDSGIVNMFGAAPLIYAGREHLERYYGEGREEDEIFQELLEMADEARDKLILGIFNYIQEKKPNIDLDDIDKFNSLARKFAGELLGAWILFGRFPRG